MANFAVGERGQYASSPFAIPWPTWWKILLRVRERMAADNMSIVAAGVSFYAFLALFPALASLVLVYGLISNPTEVSSQFEAIKGLIPPGVAEIMSDRLEEVSKTDNAGLSLGVLLSLAFALWSSAKGVKALMVAMNVAYQEANSRSFLRENVFALIFTLSAIVFVIVALAIIAAIPAAVAVLQPTNFPVNLLLWSRWIVLAVLVVGALAFLYRFAPNRSDARIPWLAPGAGLAGGLWLILSAGFSFYVTNFGNYDETFGPLSAVVVLLLWFYLSAFVVCAGAELNSELELQTYRDTTTGPPQRAGRRGAFVADHTRGPKGQIL